MVTRGSVSLSCATTPDPFLNLNGSKPWLRLYDQLVIISAY